MLWINNPLVHYNERDVEVPSLLQAINSCPPESLLDIGGSYSYATYANKVRQMVKLYDVVDPAPCEITSKVVDHYFIASFPEGIDSCGLPRYDFISSISVLEHVGVKNTLPPRGCFEPASYEERREAYRFDIIYQAYCRTNKMLFLSFPFGAEGIFPGEYMNLTSKDLELIARAFSFDAHFFFSEFPQWRLPWEEVSLEVASTKPLRPDRGVQCVCILQAQKG